MPSSLQYAGIAQLVERNLAKVEVASSSLVSRSRSEKKCQHLFAKKEASASFFLAQNSDLADTMRFRIQHHEGHRSGWRPLKTDQFTITNLPFTLRVPINA